VNSNAISLLIACALIATANSSSALTVTATSNGRWADASTWDIRVPSAGDDVVVPSSRIVTNDAPTASLSSLSVAGSLVFSGWDSPVTAATVTIDGSVTHLTNSATTTNASGGWVPDNRVFFIATNFTLSSSGIINVDGKGFMGGLTSGSPGNGPGGSTSVGSAPGGSYGGRGGPGSNSSQPAPVYGSAEAPEYPGSGAGWPLWGGVPGGAGGGAVRIAASDTVTIDGTITANGAAGPVSWGSRGSGGGIYITCRTFRGTGTIRANGGEHNGESYAGGGGGRIAIVYDTAAQVAVSPRPTVTLSASGGRPRYFDLAMIAYRGEPGTIHVSDTSFFPPAVMSGGASVVVPGLTNFAPDSLTVTGVWVRFGENFLLAPTTHVTIAGSFGRLDIERGSALQCGGDIRITNNAALWVFSAPTNNANLDFGALVQAGGAVCISTGSAMYLYSDPTNGGSPLVRCRHLTILGGGRIDADGAGFMGSDSDHLYGFGPGQSRSISPAGGASHGGRGGSNSNNRLPGIIYGSSNAPSLPGSGAGYSYGGHGGAGGGLVRVEVSSVLDLRGIISANGRLAAGDGSWTAGGSGGAIYIRCKKLTGSGGTLSARGGECGSQNACGGGGGRIAVWRVTHDYAGFPTANVQGGSGTYPGEEGTVVWGYLPAPGTIITIK